ncbi:ATP-binding cassette domain-containing protein [Leucobacter sp. PH1c]|uniref:ABC transporter ATP-binding protein/permease n=1 Tax=Leucobacter sp. PH1c TaxID=1397278 RepID=UPI000686C0D4|nr:ATP-binding cassette domain-containing protein [Leucobacter sp. PH1c]
MSAARRALTSPAFVAGALLTLALVAVAWAAPLLAPADPAAQDLTGGLQPPSPEHWLGTDQLGRDVLSRILFAAQTDLRLAVLAALAPFVIGVAVGLISGYFGGAVDWVASRATDTVIAFPFYVIVIAIVFAVGAGERGIVLAFALVGWVGYARVLRAMTAALRETGWVQAARGGGLSHARILVRHVLPNVLPQAIVLLASEIVLIMVAIVTLGYLGLGIQPPTPDWGTMIADSQQFITTHWWLPAFPGLAVVLTGVAFSLLGDGVGDALRVGGRRRGRARGGRPRNARRGTVLPGVVPSGAVPSGAMPPGAVPPGAVPSGAVPPGAVRVRGLRVHGARAAGEAGRELVSGVELDVAPGGALGIVGASGSGKSLTLRALLGLLPAGVDASARELSVGGPVGMVFQDPLTALDPLTRVGSQLRAAVQAAAASGAPERGRAAADARVRELLADVRLPDPARIARSYPHELSGGQRQRAVIALALAGDPAVLLCDEPTTALDVTVQRGVLELLAELRRERGMTLVFVSHDVAVVSELCDELIVMSDGRIVEAGATTEVLAAPRSGEARALLAAVPRLPALAPLTGAQPSADPAEDRAAPPSDAPSDAPGDAPGAEASGLVLRDVRLRYGRTVVVPGASFAVPRGQAVGLVGESGSGKTSLARAIAGQLPLAGGELRWGGERLGARRSPEQLRAIQLMPQDPASSLNPRMTVGQTLGELLRVHRIVPRRAVADRVAELLMSVRLDPALAASHPHALSGGQRQRVALARALALGPSLLVADEPTSALDVAVQAQVLELLAELRAELGLTVLLVSHDLGVVHEFCERVLVMRAGTLVETAGPGFFTAPASAYGRELLAAVPRLP